LEQRVTAAIFFDHRAVVNKIDLMLEERVGQHEINLLAARRI